MEISIDEKFRIALKNSDYYEKIEISSFTAGHCKYLKNILLSGLIFYVEKVEECPEYFEKGLTIFKFTVKGYPDFVRYSGNTLK